MPGKVRKRPSDCRATSCPSGHPGVKFLSSDKTPNQVFLLASHQLSASLIRSYEAIKKAIRPYGDLFFLFHQQQPKLPKEIKRRQHYAFTDQALLQLPYVPIANGLVPGSNHFPVFHFYLQNPSYRHYWYIEYDVKFSGDWKCFFDSFASVESDFISSHIRTSNAEPDWPWWDLTHPVNAIPAPERLRSFNPIYRISKTALAFLHGCLIDKWRGHHEVLLPTLLYHGGFRLLDFGGNGEFVPPGSENKFYTSGTPNRTGFLYDGTMRFRPVQKTFGQEKNKLYHPVKA